MKYLLIATAVLMLCDSLCSTLAWGEDDLEVRAREYIMTHSEWQHPAGGVCSCRLKTVMDDLRDGRLVEDDNTNHN